MVPDKSCVLYLKFDIRLHSAQPMHLSWIFMNDVPTGLNASFPSLVIDTALFISQLAVVPSWFSFALAIRTCTHTDTHSHTYFPLCKTPLQILSETSRTPPLLCKPQIAF